MASRYKTRSLNAVVDSLNRIERSLAINQPPDDETDNEEAYADTELEEDAHDPTFEPTTEASDQVESELQDADSAEPSTRKFKTYCQPFHLPACEEHRAAGALIAPP